MTSFVSPHAVSDEEEVVDKKIEIENSCKPQCIKQLLAVRVAGSCNTAADMRSGLCIDELLLLRHSVSSADAPSRGVRNPA